MVEFPPKYAFNLRLVTRSPNYDHFCLIYIQIQKATGKPDLRPVFGRLPAHGVCV
jgi:hypothetical protein